jgi:hypothetical protein
MRQDKIFSVPTLTPQLSYVILPLSRDSGVLPRDSSTDKNGVMRWQKWKPDRVWSWN